MANRIFWSLAEKEAIRAELINVFKEKPLLHKEEAIAAAQCVLPMARRRKVQPSMIYRVRDWIDIARREARRAPPKETPAAPPTIAPQPVAQPDLLRAILDQFLDALADKVAQRIELRMADSAPELLRVKHNPVPVSATERLQRTGVLVIGLLNQQAQTIIASFPNLDITCLTTDEALKRELLRRSHTILMTKFIPHSVQDRYRKVQNLHLCNGGVSELSATLKTIV